MQGCIACGKPSRAGSEYCSIACKDVVKAWSKDTRPPFARQCPVCVQIFFPSRKDAVYCSDRCKWRAFEMRG